MKQWWSFCLLVCLLVWSASSAEAYVREKTDTGKMLWWKKQPVEFTIDANGLGDYFSKNPKTGAVGSEFSAITASFLTWNSIQCSGNPIGLNFQSRGKSSTAVAGFDKNCKDCNTNLIVFIRDRAKWRFNQDQLAVTTTIFDTYTGEILDADIEVNAVDFQFSTQSTDKNNMKWDLQGVLTHEIGHFLGLAHSAVKEATMAPTGQPKDISLRTLHNDDITGACEIYPSKVVVGKIPTYEQVEANRGFGCNVSSSPPIGWGMLALFGLWWFRRRKS